MIYSVFIFEKSSLAVHSNKANTQDLFFNFRFRFGNVRAGPAHTPPQTLSQYKTLLSILGSNTSPIPLIRKVCGRQDKQAVVEGRRALLSPPPKKMQLQSIAFKSTSIKRYSNKKQNSTYDALQDAYSKWASATR